MLLICAALAWLGAAQVEPSTDGRVVEVTLEIGYEAAPAPPRKQPGIAVNGTIPGPVLRFREGDTARILVKNRMRDDETSIHWHGLLVPNVMDGVPYLTTPTIPPFGEYQFEFTLRQSGTYWYHSHTGLQEQVGVYGAIVVEPREGLAALHRQLGVDREVVLVAADWTDEEPHDVMRTLLRGSQWYPIRKGTAQSLLGAWRQGKLGAFFERERQRMPAMDISDIAYDHFLANGVPEAQEPAALPGERVLVRIVNAAASSYFHVTSGSGPLTIVASDGQQVQPVDVRRLLIGIAETYDVIVSVPESGEAVEVRLTAHDSSGRAALVLGPPGAPVLRATDPPRADLYGMDETLRAGLSSVSQSRGEAAATDDRPFAPYALLRTLAPSEIAAAAERAAHEGPIRTVTMRLTGDMIRYLWSIDGKTLAEEPVVKVASGEVVRIELINDTMMHHPMHLHGHFFRVITEAGAYSPVKHTVDVPPMGRRVIEFVADEEPGDWFLHCHLLYHMDAGMARVVRYAELGDEPPPNIDPRMIEPPALLFDAAFLTHMTMGQVLLMKGRQDYFLRWHDGFDGHGRGRRVAGTEEREADREIDLGFGHYFGPNLMSVFGYRVTNRVRAENRFFAGARYRLPYFVELTVTADDDRDLRFEAERALQVTARGALFGRVEYDTLTYGDWEVGASWTLDQQLGLTLGYDSDHGFGVGVTLSL